MIVCLSLTIGTNELKASTNSSKTENSLNSFEAQKKWLEYCVQVWKQNPKNTENIAKFFNEALSSEIKTTTSSGSRAP